MSNIKNLTVDTQVQDSDAARLAKVFANNDVTLVDATPKTPHYRDGKKTLHIAPKKGEVLDKCATMNKKYSCCNVHVLKSVSNCPYDCSYCFLQNYLNNGTMSVVGDIDAMITEIKEKLAAAPGRQFRIGTWELGDSLALENETGQASALIKEFAKLDNGILELRTKSDIVDPILNLDHQKRTVVSWSMNPESVIRQYEFKTASFDKRMIAIKKVVDAGYLLGFHFDPMMLFDNWESEYPDVIRQLFEIVPPEQIAWFSLGSLRFNPEMKKKMEGNFPKTVLTRPEMVLGDDGKVRYVKPLRVEMYKKMVEAIREFGDDKVLIYLCMERWDMWDKVLGWHPDSIDHLDYLFAASLHDRFGLGNTPILTDYTSAS